MSLIRKYGNVNSGLMAATKPEDDVQIGTEATIMYGRDRNPAKVVGIEYAKNGKVKGYYLQEYEWTIDFNTEGYAKEIFWDKPKGEPNFHRVVTHGHLKGTVVDAYIGEANPFYDRSF